MKGFEWFVGTVWFLGVVEIFLLSLKAFGWIDVDWWFVLVPIWLPCAMVLVGLCLYLIIEFGRRIRGLDD